MVHLLYHPTNHKRSCGLVVGGLFDHVALLLVGCWACARWLCKGFSQLVGYAVKPSGFLPILEFDYNKMINITSIIYVPTNCGSLVELLGTYPEVPCLNPNLIFFVLRCQVVPPNWAMWKIATGPIEALEIIATTLEITTWSEP